ncbi:MAG TPA: PspA/IM30 family protein [Actinobacteria bacterium]|jgi:phage shock protein A|nr:PspA/IM30 family protein [Actinomycetota bacterium]
MAIFSRLADLLKANINDLIDRAEDPEKMIKQIIIDMEEQLQKAVQGLGTVMASERQMQKQLEESKAQSALWEERAKTALKDSNEELAKQAVDNKLKADENVKQYQKMSDDISSQLGMLRNQVETLKQKLSEARNRQAILLARDKVADARKEVSDSLGSIDSTSAFAKMDKMERKIAEKEAQADAASEISGLDAEINDPFAKIEKDKAADAELQRLKDELLKE